MKGLLEIWLLRLVRTSAEGNQKIVTKLFISLGKMTNEEPYLIK